MDKKQKNNVSMWFFFTLLLGMLPIIFLLITSLFIDGEIIRVSSLTKEMFFLTIILCADILKTLYDVNDKKLVYTKTFLYGISIFVLIISSVLYGILLIYKGEYISENVYGISTALCMISVMLGFFTQIIVNQKKENCTKEEE